MNGSPFIPHPYMKKLYVELTNRCNLNCVMCYRQSWESELVDMDETTLRNLAKSVDEDVTIMLGGIGEPTIARHFDLALDLFQNHTLQLTTNGVLSPKRLQQVLTHFDDVVVSVDGTEETYYHIRKTDFKHVTKTLAAIKEHKNKNDVKTPRVEFAFVLSKRNKDSFPSVVEMANQYDAQRVLVSHLMPQNEQQTKEIYYDEHFHEEGRTFAEKMSNYAYFQKRVVTSFPYMEIKTERLCHFVENDYTYVDVYGDVVPCYRFASNYTEYVFGRKKQIKKHAFGNVNRRPLQDIYNDSAYRDFRHAVKYTLHPSCVDCELRDGCEYIETSEYDCSGFSPSCADCLWNRKIIRCT